MRTAPTIQIAWKAAKTLGRDALVAVGAAATTDQPLTVGMALFALDMENPKRAQEREDQAEAERVADEFAKEADWIAALPGGSGYRGPRGGREKEQVSDDGR